MGEVVTGKFEFDINKLAAEIQASVHDLDQLRAVIVRIRADHGSEILYQAAGHASRGLIDGLNAAMDAYTRLQWTMGVEISPCVIGQVSISSGITSDTFHSEHPPRPRPPLPPLELPPLSSFLSPEEIK